MRAGLRTAMVARDAVTVAALRSALAAVANAEAQPLPAASAAGPHDTDRAPGSEHVAGAAVGVGAAEVQRRRLSSADVLAVVVGEVEERRAAADQLRAAGRPDLADRVDAEADVLAGYLPERGAAPR